MRNVYVEIKVFFVYYMFVGVYLYMVVMVSGNVGNSVNVLKREYFVYIGINEFKGFFV